MNTFTSIDDSDGNNVAMNSTPQRLNSLSPIAVNSQMRQLFKALPDAYLLLSPQLVILEATTAYANITLSTRESLIGKKIFDAFPDNPQVPQANAVGNLRASLEQVMATGQPHHMPQQRYDIPNPEQPGAFVERYWLPRNNPVFDADGTLCYLVHSVTDITEQVQAKIYLQQSQEREFLTQQQVDQQRRQQEELFMQAPAAVCILAGPDLVYELVNPAYQQLAPHRTFIGQPLMANLTDKESNALYQTMRQVYQTGITHEQQGYRLTLPRESDGEPEDRFFDFIIQPRRTHHGQVDGLVVFAFEVTAQQQAQQTTLANLRQSQDLTQRLADSNLELLTANAQHEKTNQQLSRVNIDLDYFIYAASHDLKAPVLNIEGLLQILLEQLTPTDLQNEMVHHTSQLMIESVQRFKRTIDHLTDITKLQKESQPEENWVNLAAIIAQVQKDLALPIHRVRARVEVNVPANFLIYFSEKNARRIVYNLLSNAVKFSSQERTPHIRFEADSGSQYQVLSVEDNGLGMNTAQQQKLFGMFHRLHTNVEGAGVGLYMVKKIVEQAGGRIEVQSTAGVGSQFKIYFRKRS